MFNCIFQYYFFWNRCLIKAIFPHLCEESPDQSFPYVDVVVSTGEVRTRPPQVKPVHDPGQLHAYVISTLQGSVVDEVVIAPLRVLMVYKIRKIR